MTLIRLSKKNRSAGGRFSFPALLLFLAAWLLFTLPLSAQQNADSSRIYRNRLILVGTGGAALYGGSLIALNSFWYKDYPRSSFHFINDNDEWLQVDKMGHGFTSYYEGVYGYRMLRWAGVPQKKAAIYGGSFGFLLQTPIEIMDGFSSQWGASAGDLCANAFGSVLVVSQELVWQEQKVQLKFSFHPSPYAQYKPNLLGSSFPEQLIKDYNGQTYWLSANLNSLSPHIPSWLNLALGYGAEGMLRGTAREQFNEAGLPVYSRKRQFYLSPDIDLLKVKTRSKLLNQVLRTLAFIKVPAPALELQDNSRLRFHLIYF